METDKTEESAITSESDSESSPESNGSDDSQKPDASKKRKRHPKGTAPPGLNLEEAYDITNRIYELVGNEASYDVVGRITENSPGSSVFLKKLIALKNFGLITDINRTVKLTETGKSIAGPRTPRERAIALKQAFLSINLYSKVYDKFKGRLLPPDEFLINTFLSYIPLREFASAWMDSFKQSARKAGLFENRSDGKIVVLETINPEHHAEFVEEPPPADQKVDLVKPPAAEPPPQSPVGQYSGNGVPHKPTFGHVSKISLSGSREAEFSIPDKLTVRDAKKLKKALDGLKTIIESMVDEPEEEDLGSGPVT